MRRITKLAALAGTTLIGLGAFAGSANAAVNVNDGGVGTVGKGDVQTALGYKNDAAFQADAAAGKITFSLKSDQINVYADIKCSEANIMQPGDPFTEVHNLLGSYSTPRTPIVKALTNGAGKVTGYVASGITTGTQTGSLDWSLWSKCPTGQHFMGWLVDPSNAFHNETVPGSPVLQVSNGSTTVALPNTPVG
jgi:hypothetical protein